MNIIHEYHDEWQWQWIEATVAGQMRHAQLCSPEISASTPDTRILQNLMTTIAGSIIMILTHGTRKGLHSFSLEAPRVFRFMPHTGHYREVLFASPAQKEHIFAMKPCQICHFAGLSVTRFDAHPSKSVTNFLKKSKRTWADLQCIPPPIPLRVTRQYYIASTVQTSSVGQTDIGRPKKRDEDRWWG